MSDNKNRDDNKFKETALDYGKQSYGDYLSWDDEQRYEIIEGTVYIMSPGPNRFHQKASGDIFNQFYNYLQNKECEIYAAPFDIRLPEGNEKDEDILTVVQPDLILICDEEKLDKRGCRGAPDLIVEILSPSSYKKDKIIKRELYEKHGVKEYWLVDLEGKIVEVYKLQEDGEYGKSELYTEEENIPIGIFDGDLVVYLDLPDTSAEDSLTNS